MGQPRDDNQSYEGVEHKIWPLVVPAIGDDNCHYNYVEQNDERHYEDRKPVESVCDLLSVRSRLVNLAHDTVDDC